MKIGKQLKQAREKNKMSQEELAHLLKTTQKTISNWESDKGLPSIKHLSKIIDILKIDLTSIFIDSKIILNEQLNSNVQFNKNYDSISELKAQYETRLKEKENNIQELREQILFLQRIIENF